MDIDLLAKMVKEVMMEEDSVTLPGVGSFMAEWVPASFADKGYTIHPPYRRLFFMPRQGNDTLLADLYARSNNVSQADATHILVPFLLEMKEVLEQRKMVVLPGLGRLRATRENHFFFVADEDLDIYPAGFGLAPISLKTHQETPEEVAEAVSSLAGLLEQDPLPSVTTEPEVVPAAEPVAEEAVPAAEPVAEEKVADEKAEEKVEEEKVTEAPEGASTLLSATGGASDTAPAPAPSAKPAGEATEAPAEQPAPARRPRKAWKAVGRVALCLVAVVLIAAAALAVTGRVAPQWLDPYLYTPEQLEVLYPNR